jgi:hypothetical protein
MTASQDLVLQLIAATSFNAFDGSLIASSLRSQPEVWRSVLFSGASRPVYTPLQNPADPNYKPPPLEAQFHLMSLVSLETDAVAYDHIFILPVSRRQTELESMAKRWSTSDMAWIGIVDARKALGVTRIFFNDYVGEPERIILHCWWD